MGMDIRDYADTMLGYRITETQAQAAVRTVCVVAKRLGAGRDDAVTVLEALGLDDLALSMLTRAAS